ncbi:MAG: hypothetical protein WCH83_09070 [Alphaproteobacteria bacterium]
MSRHLASRLIVVAAASLTLASPALADSIDGRWCASDGRRMEIQGSTLITPRGVSLTGNYGRHDFAFVTPQGEPDAGTPVTMRLRGETMVHLWKGATSGEPEVWRRCTPVS